LDELYNATSGNREKAKKILSIIEEIGPDWLKLIPGVGAVLGVGLKTATRVGQHLLGADDEHSAGLSKVLSAQYVEMIFKIASAHELLCLSIKGAQWIDDASCQLLLRLAHQISEKPVVVIVSYRPRHLLPSQPFSDVRREIRIKHQPEIITLTGLSEKEIQRYIHDRFGSSLHLNLAVWLHQLCNGRPLFISQYLHLLEQQNIIQRQGGRFVLDGTIKMVSGRWGPEGALARLPIPDSVEAVIEKRISRLKEEDLEMLQIGAVQGQHFVASILAELVEKRERNLLKELRHVVDRYGVIAYYEGDGWTKGKSQSYTFEHMLMYQTFYDRLSPRERVLLHQAVADILEPYVKDQAAPPCKLVIEIARHYDLGEKPPEAARYYYLAARLTFATGAYSETIQLSQKALKNIRMLGEGGLDRDTLRVKVIQLILRASEMRWRGKPELQGDLSLDELLDEAESAAQRTNDTSLLAQIIFLKGLIFVSTKTLRDALKVITEALQISQNTGDAVLEFSIMSVLGHQTAARNLTEGLDLQYQALKIYEDRIAGTEPDKTRRGLRRALHTLQGYIGVGEFDRSNYGIAEEWLKNSIDGLRQLRLKEHLIPPLNFLSQLYIATGRFEEAEAMLKESLEIFKNDPAANPWRGYDLALLGKLYLEWDRVTDAGDPIEKGWGETQATWAVALVSLVRNYYTELLMNPHYRDYDVEKAEKLLLETLDETKSSGFHRSAIAALSLRGQLELTKHNIDKSVEYSVQAVQYLKEVGIMPALRAEEIYFNHYSVLQAAGKEAEARDYCKLAHSELMRKVDSIREPAFKESFLHRVPLSRAILAAAADFGYNESNGI
jgi:tetratricopeptide (TPR) repeat protein